MKKMTYLLAMAAVLTACGGANKGYNVTGTVEGAAQGDTVYLSKAEGRQLVNVDTAVISNGKFTFKGTQDTVAVRYIQAPKQELSLMFFLENGPIKVELTESNDVVTGTPNNDTYQAIRAKNSELQAQLNELGKEISETKDQDLLAEKMKAYEALQETGMEIEKAAIAPNITNIVGITLLKNNFYHMSVEELDPLMSQIPAEFDNDKRIADIKERVEKMKATAVGQKFIDFEMQDPDGKPVKLSDYVGKGKVVLVDFWASWCPPCRAELPKLAELYKANKAKGFEIVGVSLDRTKEAWLENGIKKFELSWPQMSDLKFWECEGAKLYAVSSIPHTVLIDGEGTIIARNLHGEKLEAKLAEVLK